MFRGRPDMDALTFHGDIFVQDERNIIIGGAIGWQEMLVGPESHRDLSRMITYTIVGLDGFGAHTDINEGLRFNVRAEQPAQPKVRETSDIILGHGIGFFEFNPIWGGDTVANYMAGTVPHGIIDPLFPYTAGAMVVHRVNPDSTVTDIRLGSEPGAPYGHVANPPPTAPGAFALWGALSAHPYGQPYNQARFTEAFRTVHMPPAVLGWGWVPAVERPTHIHFLFRDFENRYYQNVGTADAPIWELIPTPPPGPLAPDVIRVQGITDIRDFNTRNNRGGLNFVVPAVENAQMFLHDYIEGVAENIRNATHGGANAGLIPQFPLPRFAPGRFIGYVNSRDSYRVNPAGDMVVTEGTPFMPSGLLYHTAGRLRGGAAPVANRYFLKDIFQENIAITDGNNRITHVEPVGSSNRITFEIRNGWSNTPGVSGNNVASIGTAIHRDTGRREHFIEVRGTGSFELVARSTRTVSVDDTAVGFVRFDVAQGVTEQSVVTGQDGGAFVSLFADAEPPSVTHFAVRRNVIMRVSGIVNNRDWNIRETRKIHTCPGAAGSVCGAHCFYRRFVNPVTGLPQYHRSINRGSGAVPQSFISARIDNYGNQLAESPTHVTYTFTPYITRTTNGNTSDPNGSGIVHIDRWVNVTMPQNITPGSNIPIIITEGRHWCEVSEMYAPLQVTNLTYTYEVKPLQRIIDAFFATGLSDLTLDQNRIEIDGASSAVFTGTFLIDQAIDIARAGQLLSVNFEPTSETDIFTSVINYPSIFGGNLYGGSNTIFRSAPVNEGAYTVWRGMLEPNVPFPVNNVNLHFTMRIRNATPIDEDGLFRYEYTITMRVVSQGYRFMRGDSHEVVPPMLEAMTGQLVVRQHERARWPHPAGRTIMFTAPPLVSRTNVEIHPQEIHSITAQHFSEVTMFNGASIPDTTAPIHGTMAGVDFSRQFTSAGIFNNRPNGFLRFTLHPSFASIFTLGYDIAGNYGNEVTEPHLMMTQYVRLINFQYGQLQGVPLEVRRDTETQFFMPLRGMGSLATFDRSGIIGGQSGFLHEHRDLPDNTAFPFSTFDVSLNMQGLNPFSFDGNIFFRTQLTNPDRAEVGQEFEITWTTDTLISSRNRDNPTFHYTHPLRPRWVRDHVEREERTVIVVQERTGVEFTMPEFNPFGLTTNINLELIGRGTQLRGAPHLQYFGDWDENVLPIATVRTWLQPTGAGRSPGPGAIHLNWALRVPHEGLSEAAYLQLANAAFRISVPYRAYRFNNIVLGDELSPLFHFVWYTIDGIFFARAGAGRAAPILSIVLNTATRTAEDIRIEARKDRFINPGTPLHTFIDVRVDEMNRRLRNDTDRLLWSVTMGGTPIGRQEIHASEMTAQNETISRATNFEFHKGNPHQVTVTCTPELMLAGVPRLHVLGGFTRITQGQGDERDSHLVGAFMPAAAFQFSHQSHVDIRVEIEICDMVSINSLPELAGMRPGGRYILTADIVLEDWQPIPFVAAELDGNNKRIWVRSFNLSNNPMNIGIWTTIPANAMLRNLNIFLNERGPAPFGRTEVNLTAANTNYSDLRSGTLNIGVLAGQNLGIITNVAVLPSWFFVCGRENFEDRNFPVKDHEGLWGHCFHVQPGAEAGGFFREIQARDGWGEFSCKIGDNDPEEVIVDGQVRLIPARGGATVVGFSDITPEGIHSHSVANYLNNYARAMQLFQADSFGTGISDRFNPEEALGTLFVSIDNPALTLNVGGLFGVNHAAGASAGIITNSRVIANIVVGNRLVEETDDPSELPINVRRVVVAGFIGINRGTVIASSFTNGNVENHSRSAFGQGQTDPLLFGNYTAGFIGINSGNARVKANNVSGFDYRRIFDSGTNRQYGVEVEARFDASHDRAWGRIFSVAGDVAGFIFVNGEGGGSPVIEDNVISVKTVGRAIRSGFMHDNVSGLIRRNVVDNHPANRRTLAGQGYSEFMSPHGRFGNSSNNHVTVRTRPNAGITAAPTVPPGGQWSILRHTGEPNINGGFPIADSPGTILSDFIDARVHDRFYGFSMSTIASGIHDNLWMMTVNGPRIVSTEPHNIAVSIRIYSDPVNPEGTRVRAPFLNRSWENFRTGAGTTYRHFVRGEDYAHGSNRNPFIISTGIDFNQVALNTQLLNRIHDQQLGFGEPIDFEGDTVRTSAGGGGGSMRLVNNISLSHQSLGGMELLTPQIILCGGTDETPVYAETDPTRRTTFDGNSLVINDISTSATSALAATRGNLRSVGLFSQINNVVIKNVAFGFIRHGVIANYSIGAHTAVYAGGIAGRAINSKLVDVEVLSSPGGGIWSHVVGGNVTGGLIGYARNTILDTVRARISSASMAGQGEGIRPVTMNETDTAMNASFQRQALNSIGGVIPFGPGISNRADGGPSNTNFRNFFRPNIVYDDNGYYSIGQTGRRFNLSHNAHSISGGLVGILNNDSTEDGIFIRDVRNRADGSLGVFGEIVGGLFGVIKDGRVYNAIVTNTGTKTAKYFVGGIVGVNFGTIDNSGLQGENTISGGVNARAQSPTMLTGGQTASDFLVRRPHVAGTLAPITAGMVAGGVAGYNGGVLKNMTVTASVSNSNFMIAGGVVGRNTNSGEITNVRVTGGGANAGLMAGGLVGYQENDFGFVGVGEGFNLWHHGVPMMQSPANYPSINFQAQPGGIAQPDMVEVHPNLTDAQINQIRAQTLNINNTHRPRNHVITDGFIMQIHDGVHDTGREGFTRTISRFRMYQLNYSARTNASRLGVQNAFAFTVQEWQVRFERERVVAGGGPGAWSIVGTVTIPLRGLSINELVDHIPAALRDTLIGNDAPNRPNMPEGANVDDWNAGFGLTRALRGADLGSAQGNALGHNQVTSDFVSFRTPAGDGHNRVSAMGAGPGTMNTLFFDANVSEDREPEILHGSSTGHMMLPRGRGHVFHSFVDSSRVTVDAQGNFTNNINGFWNPWIGNMGFNINGSSGNNHLHMALARATR
ncbi:MAG: hypothetical protein FWC00_00845 [Firmicutes bacterium]|nr:hypothetical protein [Bacillota bacterium]